MKLRSINTHISDNLEQAPQDFKIKTSTKAFQILSSQLYTDKIGAVVRELSTNAYDAHKLVGKSDKPFEVHLPSRLNPEFYVRDFGPGLTYDQVMTLYTTYFDSDKLHTNELAGGLGLGSKTPFAYTDAFTVSSFQGGVVKLYSAFIKAGYPQIVPLSSSATEEPDGLKVSMPIKSEDFSEFLEAAIKQLRYFYPKPNITGQECEIKDVHYTVREKEFALREDTGYYNREIRVIMGPVAYPLSSDASPKLQAKVNELGYNSIDIFAEVGDVDIAASREGLSYDELSVKRLIKFLERIDEHVAQKVESYIAKADSLWEAIRMQNAFSKNFKCPKVTWRGKGLKPYITVETDYKVAIPTYEDWRRKNLKLRFTSVIHLHPDSDKPMIIYQDSPKIPLYRTLRHNERELRGKSILVAKFGANLPRLCEALDRAEWTNMSELDQPPKPVRASTRRKARIGFAKVQILNQYGGWPDSVEIDVGKYIAEANSPVVWCGRDSTTSISRKFHVYTILSDLRFLQWFDDDPRPTVLGILRSSKHVEKKLTIPHLEDWFLAKLPEHAKQYDLRLIAEFNRIVQSNLKWNRFEELMRSNEWKEYLLEKDKNFAKIYRLFDSVPGYNFSSMARYLTIYEQYTGKKPKPKTYYIEQAFNRFYNRFELLFTLPTRGGTFRIEHMKPYLNKIR